MQDLNCQFCDLFIGQCEQLAPIGPITCAICEHSFQTVKWFLSGYDERFHPQYGEDGKWRDLSWQYYSRDEQAQKEIEKLRLFMIDFLRGDYE